MDEEEVTHSLARSGGKRFQRNGCLATARGSREYTAGARRGHDTVLAAVGFMALETAVGHLPLRGANEMTLPGEDGQTLAILLGLWLLAWPIAPPVGIQRAKGGLARAPADRAWRRSGWLVVLDKTRGVKCRKIEENDVAPPSLRNGGAGATAEQEQVTQLQS